MKVAQLQEMNIEELENLASETRFELAKYKFELTTRKLDSVAKIKNARKLISRILTILTQKKKV